MNFKNKLGLTALLIVFATGFASAGVESIDRMEYTSNGDYFDGELINIQYLADSDTDQIDVFLDSGTLSDRTGQNTESDLTIDVSSLENSVYYNIGDSTHGTLYSLDPYTTDWYYLSSKDEAIDAASDVCYKNPYGKDYTLKTRFTPTGGQVRVHCLAVQGTSGTPGDITQDRIGFSTDWEVESSDGGVETATISNTDLGRGQSTRIDSNVQIEWDGNLRTGNLVPNVDDELALHSNSFQNGWRVVSEDRYSEWESYLGRSGSFLQDWADGDLDRNQVETDLDNHEADAKRLFTESDLSTSSVSDSSTNNGQLRYNTDEEFTFPSFTVFVDAGEDGFVRVNRPVGEASIIDSSGDSFAEADDGVVSMTVENTGSGEGTFVGRVTSCSNGFSPDDASERINLDPGQYYEYSFQVSGSSTDFTSGSVSGSCDMEVVEQGSQSSDSTSVDVELTQERECTGPQTVIVEDGREVIYNCDGGQPSDVVERCTADETADQVGDGTFECIEPNTPSDGSFFDGLFSGLVPDFDFSGPAGIDPVDLFDLIVSGFAAVFAFGFGSNRLSPQISPTVSGATGVSEDVLRLFVALISAVLVGYFVFSLISNVWIKVLLAAGLVAYGYIYTTLIDPIVEVIS